MKHLKVILIVMFMLIGTIAPNTITADDEYSENLSQNLGNEEDENLGQEEDEKQDNQLGENLENPDVDLGGNLDKNPDVDPNNQSNKDQDNNSDDQQNNNPQENQKSAPSNDSQGDSSDQNNGSNDQNSDPFFIVQPESVNVNYPEGATFHVEVADEYKESVVSYQWHMIDQKNKDFTFEGSSAKTDTLVVPSTVQRDQYLRFYCVVTDSDGVSHKSNIATLDLINRHTEDKPVLYVGEYHIEPGETINLADKTLGDGKVLGSGTITYDANGTDLTFDNVNFDNTYRIASMYATANVGISLEWHLVPDTVEAINVTFVGENKILNHYKDEANNLAGIPFHFCFWGDESDYRPLVNFKGDGSLYVMHGTECIGVIGDLCVDIDLTVDQTRDFYSAGINANNVKLCGGHDINLKTNGYVIRTAGNIFIDNVNLNVDMLSPHISVGTTSQDGLQAHGNLIVNDSDINFTARFKQSLSGEVGGETFMVGKKTEITNSDVSINIQGSEENDDDFAHHFIGIYGETVKIDASNIDVTANSKNFIFVCGVKALNKMDIVNDSNVIADISVSTGALGVYVSGPLTITDSSVAANAINLKHPNVTPFAITATKFDIDMNENTMVYANASNVASNDAVAFAAMKGPYYLHDTENTPTFEAGEITLADDTFCVIPLNNEIAKAQSTIQPGQRIELTTFIDKDTNKIPQTLIITYVDQPEPPAVVDYPVVSGEGSTWQEGTGSALSFRITREIDDKNIRSHFRKVKVDDKVMDPEYYNLKDGSLVVELKPNLLNKLAAGQHKLTVVFDDGEADATFYITKNKPHYVPPVTGVGR